MPETESNTANKIIIKNANFKLDEPTRNQLVQKLANLVTIETDHTDNQNNILFKINSSLTGQELDNTILHLIEFITQQKQPKIALEISGYKNNPTMALRIYQFALVQELSPSIDPNILKAWEEGSANDASNPAESHNFKKNISYYEKYKNIARDPKKINKLRKLLVLLQKLKTIKPRTTASPAGT